MEAAIRVIMRVPGLFLLDHWWRHERNKSLPNALEYAEISKCFISNLVLLHGFLLLLLPLRHVRALYTHFVSGALIISCHVVSGLYVEMEMTKHDNANFEDVFFRRQVFMFAFHGIVGCIISCLLKGPWMPIPAAFSIYALTVINRLSCHIGGFPLVTLPYVHIFCSAAQLFNVFLYITYQIPNILDCAKLAYIDALAVTETYGIGTFCTLLWDKLFVPNHFVVFWLIEFVIRLLENIYEVEEAPWGREWYIMLLTTLSTICASPVTLVATSVSISYTSFFTLCSTRAYLQGPTAFFQNNPMHSGWTEGLTLILLSMQTGLTDMKMPSRMAVMTIILFIVLSSLLQSMLEIAEPVVFALSASRSRSVWRHFRALSLCFALLVFPLYLTHLLTAAFPIDFWMVIVLSSCTLTSLQVLDLLVVHSLFLYDSSRAEPWDNLDDIVYYTRAVTKVLEFLVAVFVVAMGLWENTSSKFNLLNASILLVHSYFNVWQRWQTGWHSFLLRREAAKKISSLPEATEEQLAKLDDVCSICFSGMKTACMTSCQHFFHRTCLRKWLSVQDKCPLCHGSVSIPSVKDENIEQDIHAGPALNNMDDNQFPVDPPQ